MPDSKFSFPPGVHTVVLPVQSVRFRPWSRPGALSHDPILSLLFRVKPSVFSLTIIMSKPSPRTRPQVCEQVEGFTDPQNDALVIFHGGCCYCTEQYSIRIFECGNIVVCTGAPGVFPAPVPYLNREESYSGGGGCQYLLATGITSCPIPSPSTMAIRSLSPPTVDQFPHRPGNLRRIRTPMDNGTEFPVPNTYTFTFGPATPGDEWFFFYLIGGQIFSRTKFVP